MPCTPVALCREKCTFDGQGLAVPPRVAPGEAAASTRCCPVGRGGPCGAGAAGAWPGAFHEQDLLTGHQQLVPPGCSFLPPFPWVDFNFQAEVAKQPF